MNLAKMQLLILILIIGLVLPSLAAMEMVSKQYDAKDQLEGTTTLSIDGENLVMEYRSKESNVRVVFRGDKDLLWVINLDKNSYMELTRARVEELASMRDQAMAEMGPQMDQMRKMMKERLKDMTPQQREAILKSMPGGAALLGEEEADKGPRFRKVAGGVSIGQWSTTHYRAEDDGKVEDEVWTAEPSALGISKADVQVFENFASFFEPLYRNMGEQLQEFYRIGSADFEKENGYSGVPVQAKSYSGGRLKSVVKTESITDSAVPAAKFELQDGLKKDDPFEKMESMRQR